MQSLIDRFVAFLSLKTSTLPLIIPTSSKDKIGVADVQLAISSLQLASGKTNFGTQENVARAAAAATPVVKQELKPTKAVNQAQASVQPATVAAEKASKVEKVEKPKKPMFIREEKEQVEENSFVFRTKHLNDKVARTKRHTKSFKSILKHRRLK